MTGMFMRFPCKEDECRIRREQAGENLAVIYFFKPADGRNQLQSRDKKKVEKSEP